jgi:hypothetical protein
MPSLHKLARITIALGVLTLVALGFSFLALNDIAHGESDLSLEWGILQATTFLIVMFVALAVVTLVRVLKLKSD